MNPYSQTDFAWFFSLCRSSSRGLFIAPGGYVYHVFNRANGPRPLFVSDADYEASWPRHWRGRWAWSRSPSA